MPGHGRVSHVKNGSPGDPPTPTLSASATSALGFWKAIEEGLPEQQRIETSSVRRAHVGRTDEVTRIFCSTPTLASVAHLGATNIDRPNAGGHQMPAR